MEDPDHYVHDQKHSSANIGGIDVRKMESDGDGKIRKVKVSELIFRVLGVLLTLVAAIILGVNKQTKLVSLQILSNFPPVHVSATAKSHYVSAFVYCIVVNAMASAYGAVSLLLLTRNRGRKSLVVMMITLIDLVIVALLFSGNGAAGAIGLMGFQGSSHLQWNKVCNVFGKFCVQTAVAIIFSLLASIVFLCLVLFTLFTLYKISY